VYEYLYNKLIFIEKTELIEYLLKSGVGLVLIMFENTHIPILFNLLSLSLHYNILVIYYMINVMI
jgi:hypothetical protein